MIQWKITYYNKDVYERLLHWPAKLLGKYLRMTELIEIYGADLGTPLTRSLGNGLFEMRVKIVTRLTHKQFEKKALADPAVKEAYDALNEEFELMAELIKTRKMRKKSQKEVAEAMGTSASAVSRLEAGATIANGHSPSLATLRRYARALGCKLNIKLIPEERL